MAGITALRDAAREAVFSAGGRGFVRFLDHGDALLVSDAPRRCADEAQIEQMIHALKEAGFSCRIEAGLAYMTPEWSCLQALCAAQPAQIAVHWESPLFSEQALCQRLLKEAPQTPDEDGACLVMETARMIWRMKHPESKEMEALRARIAARLREKKRSGLHEAGRLLCGWLRENEN